MTFLRNVLILAVAMILALAVGGADAAQKKKKNKGIKGSITAVEPIKGSDDVNLTIKAINKKTKEAKEVKVIAKKEGTKVEKMVGKKKDNQTTSASIADLKAGQLVLVTTRQGQADQAERILLASRKKKQDN